MSSVTDWGSRVTTYTYDLAGRVTAVLRPGGSKRLITYDAAGQRTKIEELGGGSAEINLFKLHYDTGGRTDWEFIAPIPVPYTESAQSITYDADNRIATFGGNSVTHDADGNMIAGPLGAGTFVSSATTPGTASPAQAE